MDQIRRHRFNIDTDTGTQGDTGPGFWGEITQIRFEGENYDTGGDLLISLVPEDGDTGDGILFYNNNDCLGANFTQLPRSGAVVDNLGLDTGVDLYEKIVSSGEHLRFKCIPGDTGDVSGTVFVYTKR